jgi:hypothetical protein
MKKLIKLNKIIYTLIFAVLSTLVFIVNIARPNMSFYANDSILYQYATEVWLSLKEFDTIYVTLFIFIYYAYYNIYFDGTKLSGKSFINSAIAIILTTITLIGKCYKIDNTLNTMVESTPQIIKFIILSFGYYFIFDAIIKKITSIKININSKKKSPRQQKIEKFLNKYQTPISILIILLCWMPYIILYYPGASTGDTFDCLSQFFHRDESWSIKTMNLLNEDVYINKHHPPLFTVVLGLVFKLGKYFKDFTLGALIYTILQVSLLLIIFSFILHYMKKNKVPLWIRISSILFIGLTPTIAAYAITAIKDTPNAIFTVLYAVFLLQIVRNYDSIFKNKIRLLFLLITMLLVLMLRNNGFFTIILSFPFLIIKYKEKWKKIMFVLVLPLIIFYLYDKVLLTSLDVTDASIKETLTVPFMQVARVVKYNSSKISESDKEIINKVLSYDAMTDSYNPDLADSVKDTYNKYTTKEELKDFFKLWFKYLKKYPLVYIESLFNSTYGYFFPEVGEDYATLAVDARVGKDTYINIKSVDKYKDYRNVSYKINKIASSLPFFCFFNHVAFYDWFLIFTSLYIIKKKNYKYLIPLFPLISVLLVCLASPINGSFRYILPIVFSIPILLTIIYFTYKEDKKYTQKEV